VIRGYTLWAWSAEHSQVLLDFLGGTERDPAMYASYARSLLHLPKAVITAKVRPFIVKRIAETLLGEDR
jgi:hypothetical protein